MRGYFLLRECGFSKGILNEKGYIWNDFPSGFRREMRVLGIKLPAEKTISWERCLKTVQKDGCIKGQPRIRDRRKTLDSPRLIRQVNDSMTIVEVPFPLRNVTHNGRSWFLGRTRVERSLIDTILDTVEDEPCFETWARLWTWEEAQKDFAVVKLLTKRAFAVHFLYDDNLYLFKKSGTHWKPIYIEHGKKYDYHLSADKKTLTVLTFKLTEPPTACTVRLRSGKTSELPAEVAYLLATNPKPLMEE
jgi:hypothetical protein